MHATPEDDIRGILLQRAPGLLMVLDTPKGLQSTAGELPQLSCCSLSWVLHLI